MRLFLTILKGPSPSEAEPLFATEDEHVIRLVGSWVARRLHRTQGDGETLDGCEPAHQPGGFDDS